MDTYDYGSQKWMYAQEVRADDCHAVIDSKLEDIYKKLMTGKIAIVRVVG